MGGGRFCPGVMATGMLTYLKQGGLSGIHVRLNPGQYSVYTQAGVAIIQNFSRQPCAKI